MLKIGSVIDGKYKILNIVGKGGMSIVYLAMNEKVNKQWAIKEIIKRDYRDFDLEKKEIEMMKRLKHPNLPTIVDVIEGRESLLIVMDYIEGRSLEDIVQEYGPQSEKAVISWTKQLCDVLQYLHTRTPPIIYRDMKPGNIMLKPDGNIMLIDFGAAREYKPDHLKDTVLLGTRGYAAPEQYRPDGQSDARTDIYSLGVTVFRLLTGANPQELCPVRKIRPEISPGIERILQKCTAVVKKERYSSAEELLEALKRYWEYDEKYQQMQKKKLYDFLIPCFLTLLFAAGFLAFGMSAYFTRVRNYEVYLLAAGSAVSKAEEIENYRKAIRLSPEREEAYLKLLQDGFLDDGLLSVEESELLRMILNEESENGRTMEVRFRQNNSGYAGFSYEAGIIYFYKYEDKSSKKYARGYFETASAASSLDEKKRKRAERLYVIADYYHQIGQIDEAGDQFVTYKDYWEDLTAATEGNLVEDDNERTALVMYLELTDKILSKTKEFKDAGIRKEELQKELDEMKKHLADDFVSMNAATARMLKEELNHLRENLQKAERMVESVYGTKEE